MIFTESPRRQQVTKMVAWGHWFALANIILALIISSIYIFSSPPPGSWLGNTYMLANWLGHISFITFISFVIFVLPYCYLLTNNRTIRLTGSIVAAIGLAILVFDALLYTRTGFHISFSSVKLVRSVDEIRVAEFGWKQWFYLLLLFCIWLGCQLLLANAIWRRLERLSRYKLGPSVTSFFLTCFVTSHGIHIWADAELYQPVVKQDSLFPLSYPATAKTTMSRYGLLDLEAYKQREKLQFSGQVTNIRYPSDAIYCGVDQTQSALVLVQTDNYQAQIERTHLFSDVPLYSTSTSAENKLLSTVFGVPEIYANPLATSRPVLLALPKAQGVAVSVSDNALIEHPIIASYSGQFDDFAGGIHLAFMDGKSIEKSLQSMSFENTIVLVATNGSEQQNTGRLYANLPLNAQAASNEDIAPTLLSALGCQSPIEYYSTGRDLMAPSRNWIVSTSGEKIVVIYDDQRIEVMSNGNYEIINLIDNTRSGEGLNINLLSQAMKHLSRFSKAN